MFDRKSVKSLQNHVDVLAKFPDQNPNPVFRTDEKGRLLYANIPGQRLIDTLGIEIGGKLPDALIAHSDKPVEDQLELSVGARTFAFHVVSVPELSSINIYGTDITAMKAITRFPDQNPNPVFKLDMNGVLTYANEAGQRVVEDLGICIGQQFPAKVVLNNDTPTDNRIEMLVGSSVFTFQIVHVPEFEFINIYGTDITAQKENESILIKLAKYFSHHVFASIFSGDLEVKIQTQRKKLTIFFSDIKGFGEITERLEPEELTELLTEYLTAMTDIATKYGGTVDKYIGDAIMIFFGDPKTLGTKEDALSCVSMALEMKNAMQVFRRRWLDKGISQPLDIRMGIHTDTCTVGNFGSQDRLDYTTIGNGVNLASRLESCALPNQILISEETYLLVRDTIACERLEKIVVKNIKHPVQTYEVRGQLSNASNSMSIEESDDGFRLYIDPENIDDVIGKRLLLSEALALLDRLSKDKNE
mgnify:FL=1